MISLGFVPLGYFVISAGMYFQYRRKPETRFLVPFTLPFAAFCLSLALWFALDPPGPIKVQDVLLIVIPNALFVFAPSLVDAFTWLRRRFRP